MQLGPHGKTLLQNLRKLFGGNHVDASDILPTSESTEKYTATAYVVWQFEHDLTTSTSKGNASAANGHFGYRAADYQSHLQRLCQQAVHSREIRGAFMQRIDAAGANGLELSSAVQPVHDFGSYSVFRQCGACTGSGRIACGACFGRGKRSCGGCGGAGWHNETITHTRWNGHRQETYSQVVQRTCSSCGGGGRVVCTSCGGSGKQTCNACAGHGFFTDVCHVRAIARPSWHVPRHTGLAADALVRAMELRGPRTVRELMPLELAGSEYSESDNWVVRYTGTADVVVLGVAVANVDYTVAAAGIHVIPIETPPVFEQLLARELEDIASLASGGKRGRASIRRQAKRLFAVFRGVPILDKALQSVAKLGKDVRLNPVPVVIHAAEGFISREAASAIATAFLHTLDKVSPANSRAAWALAALVPAIASFVYAANAFTAFSPANPLHAVLPLCVAVAGAAVAMLVVSPAGWILSAAVSSLFRLKVPPEYRQRGRNWAPLKGACLFAMSASFVGALYGAAAAMQWVPNIRTVATPVVDYAIAHTSPGGGANRLFAGLANSTPATASASAEPPADIRRAVQRFLIAHGYLRGQADGNFGALTTAAIARYERQETLDPSTPLPELLAHMRTVAHPAPTARGVKPIVQSPTENPNRMLMQPETAAGSTSPALRSRGVAADTTNEVAAVACKNDGTFFGKTVCQSPALAESYRHELREYEAAQRRLGGVDNGIRIEQESWLDSVVHDCLNTQCLTSAFDKRAADLSARYRGG
ncbi:MAG: hypothetical protein EPN57_09960 [Paraburkholderia sp.]|nr:MAG: hypothetical protein EPN57_09960 [Paraburkholderia sp.]